MTPKEFKEIREELKISQEQFATRLGLSPKTIWNYENGKIPVPELTARYLRMVKMRHQN